MERLFEMRGLAVALPERHTFSIRHIGSQAAAANRARAGRLAAP